MAHIEILDAVQLGERMKMHPQVLRRLARAGMIPHMRVGGSIRFAWPSVLTELERRG